MNEVFDLIDSDGSGGISLTEVEAFNTCLPQLIPNAQLKDFYHEADLNQDGVISRDEFRLLCRKLQLYASISSADMQQLFKEHCYGQLFEMVDQDQGGTVTSNELLKLVLLVRTELRLMITDEEVRRVKREQGLVEDDITKEQFVRLVSKITSGVPISHVLHAFSRAQQVNQTHITGAFAEFFKSGGAASFLKKKRTAQAGSLGTSGSHSPASAAMGRVAPEAATPPQPPTLQPAPLKSAPPPPPPPAPTPPPPPAAPAPAPAAPASAAPPAPQVAKPAAPAPPAAGSRASPPSRPAVKQAPLSLSPPTRSRAATVSPVQAPKVPVPQASSDTASASPRSPQQRLGVPGGLQVQGAPRGAAPAVTVTPATKVPPPPGRVQVPPPRTLSGSGSMELQLAVVMEEAIEEAESSSSDGGMERSGTVAQRGSACSATGESTSEFIDHPEAVALEEEAAFLALLETPVGNGSEGPSPQQMQQPVPVPVVVPPPQPVTPQQSAARVPVSHTPESFSPPSPQFTPSPGPCAVVFVKPIPHLKGQDAVERVTRWLTATLERHGAVESMSVVIPKGYARVLFDSARSAEAAVQASGRREIASYTCHSRLDVQLLSEAGPHAEGQVEDVPGEVGHDYDTQPPSPSLSVSPFRTRHITGDTLDLLPMTPLAQHRSSEPAHNAPKSDVTASMRRPDPPPPDKQPDPETRGAGLRLLVASRGCVGAALPGLATLVMSQDGATRALPSGCGRGLCYILPPWFEATVAEAQPLPPGARLPQTPPSARPDRGADDLSPRVVVREPSEPPPPPPLPHLQSNALQAASPPLRADHPDPELPCTSPTPPAEDDAAPGPAGDGDVTPPLSPAAAASTAASAALLLLAGAGAGGAAAAEGAASAEAASAGPHQEGVEGGTPGVDAAGPTGEGGDAAEQVGEDGQPLPHPAPPGGDAGGGGEATPTSPQLPEDPSPQPPPPPHPDAAAASTAAPPAAPQDIRDTIIALRDKRQQERDRQERQMRCLLDDTPSAAAAPPPPPPAPPALRYKKRVASGKRRGEGVGRFSSAVTHKQQATGGSNQTPVADTALKSCTRRTAQSLLEKPRLPKLLPGEPGYLPPAGCLMAGGPQRGYTPGIAGLASGGLPAIMESVFRQSPLHAVEEARYLDAVQRAASPRSSAVPGHHMMGEVERSTPTYDECLQYYGGPVGRGGVGSGGGGGQLPVPLSPPPSGVGGGGGGGGVPPHPTPLQAAVTPVSQPSAVPQGVLLPEQLRGMSQEELLQHLRRQQEVEVAMLQQASGGAPSSATEVQQQQAPAQEVEEAPPTSVLADGSYVYSSLPHDGRTVDWVRLQQMEEAIERHMRSMGSPQGEDAVGAGQRALQQQQPPQLSDEQQAVHDLERMTHVILQNQRREQKRAEETAQLELEVKRLRERRMREWEAGGRG